MELKERIAAYIIKNAPITMDAVISAAKDKGFDEGDILTALDTVHKDKRIVHVVSTAGVVTYKLAIAKTTPSVNHVSWLSQNYPRPGIGDVPSFIMPFPEIDYSFIFMNREEALAYKAEAKGMPIHLIKKHEYSRK